MTTKSNSNLEQKLGLAVLLLLIIGCLLVLRPFVTALLWAVVLTISSWPLYQRFLRWTGQRRTLAALLMFLGMVVIVLVPLTTVGLTLADNVSVLTTEVRKWIDAGPPKPPQWLGKVPVIGAKAVASWEGLASDTGKLLEKSKEYIQPVSAGLLKGGLTLGRGLLELALSVFISFFLFRNGVAAADRLKALVERVSGEQGRHLLILAGQTVRGVVYGILGTALAQALLMGLGLIIAGVPGAALLAMLTFFVSVVPLIGTGLVWVPASLWLLNQGSTGWCIFLAIWGLGVGNVDNVIKPWLISQGSNMPFLLIFIGVLGGALAFGFIGVFLGPTLLAVGYRLLAEWASVSQPGAGPPPADADEG